MPNLPIEVTHSLSFLSNTLRDAKKIYKSSSNITNELYKMDLKKDGAPGQMRKKSADYRDDTDDEIDIILEEFKIFQKEMSDVVKNKNTETVVYSLRKYRELYLEFKDLKKDFKKLSKKTDIKTSKCSKDKDYIRYIAINKSTVPLFQMIQIIDACIYALEHLLDIKEKTKKEA